MNISFDVQVLDDGENGVEGVKVDAFFSEGDAIRDLFKSGRQTEFTDADGHAVFDCTMSHRFVTFHCRSKKFGPYEVGDGESFTLNI